MLKREAKVVLIDIYPRQDMTRQDMARQDKTRTRQGISFPWTVGPYITYLLDVNVKDVMGPAFFFFFFTSLAEWARCRAGGRGCVTGHTMFALEVSVRRRRGKSPVR